MDFTGIGKIGNFVKQKNLIFAANYKIKTGQRIVDSNGRLNFSKSTMFEQIVAAQKKSKSEVDKARLSSIKQKLLSGKKLTESEMNFLRENDPKTYKKAKYADDAREELKAALKNAKTKQEAQQALMQAMVKVAAEATAELAALKNGAAGGGGAGAGADLGAENLPDAEGMVSANAEMSADFQENISEISEATNQNVAENSEAMNQNLGETSDENSVAQNENPNSPQENDDEEFSAADIVDKFIMAMRALQDEWLQFIKSDEYKDLPENLQEEIDSKIHGRKKSYTPDFKAIDAILAYQSAMSAGDAV